MKKGTSADRPWGRRRPTFVYAFYVLTAVGLVVLLLSGSAPFIQPPSQWFAIPYRRRPEVVNADLFLPPLRNRTENRSGDFLVYSNACQIHDVDPFDESIVHLVRYKPPLDCSRDYPLGTFTDGRQKIFINLDIIRKFKGLSQHDSVTCCYRTLQRTTDDGDDGFRISRECTNFQSGDVMRVEFVKVECRHRGWTIFTNFHAFIQEKPSVERRCRTAQQGEVASKWNVLIVGIDAVSRLNFRRQFRRTFELLKDRLEAVEMFGYTKIGDNTLPNILALMTGYNEKELIEICWPTYKAYFDACPMLWKAFALRGYRTLYAEDTPTMASFNFVKKGFFEQPTDYYLRPLMLAFEKELGRRKDMHCHLCVGPVSETELVLDWTRQFADRFRDRPYFSLSWINSGTHDYLNYGSMVDDVYHKHISDMHEGGMLNRTLLVVLSDHGLRWGDIQQTYVGKLEDRLPTLFLALPDQFKKTYPDLVRNLKENTHRLTTPYDLHATLVHLLQLVSQVGDDLSSNSISSKLLERSQSRSVSLFGRVPLERSCVDADIDEHWCCCQPSEPMSTSDVSVVRVAAFLVKTVNAMFDGHPQCERLVLGAVTDARFRRPSDSLKSQADIFLYTVTVKTSPGDALFEGTVEFSPHREETPYVLLGDISRLNIYANQSHCVQNATLKKYCYCRL